MRKLLTAAFLAVALLTLTGCPTVPTDGQGQQVVVPRTPTQTVYALQVSLTTATNALADVHDKGIVTGPSYEKAKALVFEANSVLKKAREAATAKDATKADVLINTVRGLIDQIAVYNGGKK